MKTKLCHIVLCLFLIGGLQLISGLALAADSAGMVLSVVDGAWLERGGQKLTVKSKDAVQVNDVVSTDDRGKVQILFNDNTVVAIGNNSSLAIADFVFDDASKGASFSAKMTEGVARFVTGKIVGRNRDGFSVKTPSATVGIRGTTFAVEVSSSGVTDVTGLSINPAFPVSVTNSQTGATAIIDKNGLAVKAASAGNTSYMAPAGKLAGLDAAVKINGGSQTPDKADDNASGNTQASSSAQKTDSAAQSESGDDGEDDEGGGNDSGGDGANGSGASSGSGSANDSGATTGTVGGAQSLSGGGMSGGPASGNSATTASMDTSGGVMPSSALRLVASIPSPATDMVSPDKGLADIPHELILNDDTSGGVLGGGPGGGTGGGGTGGNPGGGTGGNPGGGTGGNPGGGTGGNPGGGTGGGTPVINYQGSYAGSLTRSNGSGIGTFSFKVGLGAGSGADKITDGIVDYQPTGLGGANVALEQSSNYSKVQGGNFDIMFSNQSTGANHMQMHGNINGSHNISGNWNSWGTVPDSAGTLVDMNGHNGTITGGKTP